MKLKKRSLLKFLNTMVTSILVVLLVSVAGIVISTKLTNGQPELFGYQLKTVLSGSMEPGIATGSVIAVKTVDEEERVSLKQGDVITFKEDNKLVTHRISEVKKTSSSVLYVTKGDNNDALDSNPVLAENVQAVYKGFTIPNLGYFINFTQSPNGSIFFMIVPGILILGYSILSIWKTLRQLEDKYKNNTLPR
ncbi:signal peptidase I SipW [Metabacillus litoralis]|uniref:signal peptidase I SipW n=1 Tax=Metabacillus litoralis TaxID=152268 RepID=UPI001CFF5478|nr:signal peptidase I [Metabacillus litoralis]